jgi:hypothetical protein
MKPGQLYASKQFAELEQPIGISWRNAYHLAGRAAAIHLGNEKKQLPAIHFQIVIALEAGHHQKFGKNLSCNSQWMANMEGGVLTQPMLSSDMNAASALTPDELEKFHQAFEADIVNQLVGPLSEAKYIALRDNQTFDVNRIYLGALKFHGAKAALNLINHYMEFRQFGSSRQNKKLAELFLAAYGFISNQEIWQTICDLSNFIVKQNQTVISCETLVERLQDCATANQSPVLGQSPISNRYFLQSTT